MNINIEINETMLRDIICRHINRTFGDELNLNEKDIKIQVKSKQNYKSEWEAAEFRASVNKTT